MLPQPPPAARVALLAKADGDGEGHETGCASSSLQDPAVSANSAGADSGSVRAEALLGRGAASRAAFALSPSHPSTAGHKARASLLGA